MIELKFLNAESLNDFTTSEAYQQMPEWPISIQRAISHIHNPRCRKDDTLLILAYDGAKMVGYLGALPDDIFDNNNEIIHCAWMSCLWVNPNYRGRKIAKILFEAAFKEYNDNILLTDFDSTTEMMYTRLGTFDTFRSIIGKRYYIRSNNAQILAPKSPIFKRISPILQVIDSILNTGIDIFKKLKIAYIKTSSIVSLDINNISPNHIDLIKQSFNYQYFRRDERDLRWMINEPWIREKPAPDVEDKKYYFSSNDKIFKQYTFELRRNQEELIAFMIFTNRNGHLKIPYFYQIDQINSNEIQQLLINFIEAHNIHTLTIFKQGLIRYLDKFTIPALFIKGINRKYIMSKTLNQRLAKSELFIIHDGDGDCGFT